MVSHSNLARALWSLGFPEQALQHSQAACTLAQEVAHPLSLAQALVFAATVHQCRREVLAAHAQAAAAMTLATEQGFVQWVARGTVLHGWALAMQGQGEAGLAAMRQGLAAELATGATLYQPYVLGLLAEAYGAGGHPDEGLTALAEALAVTDTTELRYYAAELSRLKGALLLQQAVPDAAQAEACFQQALDVARQQQAKSLGTARRHEPGAPVAAAGQAGRSPRRCWRRSTAGSPRALTPPTSRRRRRCWRSALDNDATGTVGQLLYSQADLAGAVGTS